MIFFNNKNGILTILFFQNFTDQKTLKKRKNKVNYMEDTRRKKLI